MSEPFPRTRWSEIAGISPDAAAYQRRFDALEESGEDVHGEARFVASLVPPGSRILDAGCGTGRVAKELTRRGYRCVGVDEDAAMVAYATANDPATRYVRQDLTDLFLRSQKFDLVLMAGNVVPLLAPGTLPEVMRHVSGHVERGGLVVAGFGLDAAHLPPGCPVTSIEDYDAACWAAGLLPEARYPTWEGGDAWNPSAAYVVDLHRRT